MSTDQPVLFIHSANGCDFAAVIVRPLDTYGADQHTTHMPTERRYSNLVEFWDLTHPFDPITAGATRRGQFTGARYYTATLLESLTLRPQGLNLHGGVAEWSLSADVIPALLAFLTEHEPPEPQPCLACGTPFLTDESPLCPDCRTGDTHQV